MKRHRRQGVGQGCLIEENGFDAVRQQHCNASASSEAKTSKGVTPTLNFIVALPKRPVAPRFLHRIPGFPTDCIRTLFYL